MKTLLSNFSNNVLPVRMNGFYKRTQRRMVLAAVTGLSVGLCWLGVAVGATNSNNTQIATNQYRALNQAQPAEQTGKIEVVEFFWYECPHCNEFEPMLETWQKQLPKDVVLKRVPVAFRDEFTAQQKMFYTIEILGKLPEWHGKIFNEIHIVGNRIRTAEQFAAFAEKNGIEKKKVMDIFNSFAVQTKVQQAKALANTYKIDSVPMLAIDGQYVTSATIAGGTNQVALQVVDFLIDKNRKAKAVGLASNKKP
jgi:protein dithiol oxidoreductase (disulfide-forming)